MTSLDLHEAVVAGIPTEEVARLISSFKLVPRRQLLTALKLNERTLQHLIDSRLPPAASGAALDLGCLMRAATGVLGSADEAERWLTRPAVAFRGRFPLELMVTRQGTQIVFDNLVRLQHGVYI